MVRHLLRECIEAGHKAKKITTDQKLALLELVAEQEDLLHLAWSDLAPAEEGDD